MMDYQFLPSEAEEYSVAKVDHTSHAVYILSRGVYKR